MTELEVTSATSAQLIDENANPRGAGHPPNVFLPVISSFDPTPTSAIHPVFWFTSTTSVSAAAIWGHTSEPAGTRVVTSLDTSKPQRLGS